MTPSTPGREVWIGLVEVRPDDGNDIFDGAPGAFSNVLALAHSLEDYMTITAEALLKSGLIAVGVDDPEPLRERQSRMQLSDEILDLGEHARRGDVVWSTWHVFESDGRRITAVHSAVMAKRWRAARLHAPESHLPSWGDVRPGRL